MLRIGPMDIGNQNSQERADIGFIPGRLVNVD
jgi:hypothetical protein